MTKVLWSRPKDVADLLVLSALPDRLDAPYIRRTLEGLIAPGDSRHLEVERLLGGTNRCGPARVPIGFRSGFS